MGSKSAIRNNGGRRRNTGTTTAGTTGRNSSSSSSSSSSNRRFSPAGIAALVFLFIWGIIILVVHYSIASLPTTTAGTTVGHQDVIVKNVKNKNGGMIPPAEDVVVRAVHRKKLLHDLDAKGRNGTTTTKALPIGYGWQPEIPSVMECPWRDCFVRTVVCQTCRMAEDDIGPPPDVPDHWIPDPTMLHRMFLEGKDAQGNPWPPPLSSDLCDNIGVFGGHTDDNKKLLSGIKGQPFDETGQGPKIFCGVYTMKNKHATNIRAIRETWGPLCHGFLAFSTATDPRIPAISLPHDGPEEYNNMWAKVRSIWQFVGEHYVDDYDYFFLGGDDLFVIPQNLRNYLSTLGSSDDLHFAGRRFKGGGKDNYFNSGGAGYAMSRGTLRKLVPEGLNDRRCHVQTHTPMEDVMIADCLRTVFGIGLTDTRDEAGRERFHPFSPGTHLSWRPPGPGQPRDWYEDYNKEWGVKLGTDCCAPDSVSFHYIKNPAMVRHLHALLYDCRDLS